MIICNYTLLFGIEFLHDGYANRNEILRDISIVPDETTAQYLAGYRLHLKAVNNKLCCFVQTVASIGISGGVRTIEVINKPLVAFNEKATLRFSILLNSARFFDRSNLRFYYTGPGILSFGNDSGNKRNALLSLSAKIPAYDPSAVYRRGMFTINAGNQLFEAIQDNDSTDPKNTSNHQYWKHLAAYVQYVNQADIHHIDNGHRPFALVSISFRKNLTNKFSLLQKSNDPGVNNTILHKEYLIHFKNFATS